LRQLSFTDNHVAVVHSSQDEDEDEIAQATTAASFDGHCQSMQDCLLFTPITACVQLLSEHWTMPAMKPDTS